VFLGGCKLVIHLYINISSYQHIIISNSSSYITNLHTYFQFPHPTIIHHMNIIKCTSLNNHHLLIRQFNSSFNFQHSHLSNFHVHTYSLTIYNIHISIILLIQPLLSIKNFPKFIHLDVLVQSQFKFIFKVHNQPHFALK